MTLETRFDGATLPDGWTATEPTGSSVTVGTGQLVLHIDGGLAFDSIFSTGSDPEGPRVTHALGGGDLDIAVQLGEEITNLTRGGLDLIVLGAGTDAVRMGLYCQDASNLETLTFAYARSSVSGSGSKTISSPDMNGGHGGWLRITLVDDQWTMWHSPSGRSGDWLQLAQFTSVMDPATFMIHAVSTNSDQVEGRDQRIVRVVDLQARGTDDATEPVPTTIRTTVLNANLGGASLPSGLSSDTANGGSVTVADGHARLSIDMSVDGSYAWLLVDNEPAANQGLLVQYRKVAGTGQSFYTIAIRMDDAPAVPGFTTPDDQYGVGVGYLLEGNLGNSGTRFIRRNPVRSGGDFEEPYTFLYDEANENPSVGWIWVRIEAFGDRIRAKQWNDAIAVEEPTEWEYDVEDAMRPSGRIAFTFSHNDGTSGDTAVMEIATFQVYELSEEIIDPNAVDVFVLDDGVEVPVTPYVLRNGIERPTAWSVVTT